MKFQRFAYAPAQNIPDLRIAGAQRRVYAALVSALVLAILPPVSHAAPSIRRIGDVEIAGNKTISSRKIQSELLTRPRPWYQFWRARPELREADARQDRERIHRVYEREGFYEADVRYELQSDDDSVTDVRFLVDEGHPVSVNEVRVSIDGDFETHVLRDLGSRIELRPGDRFNESTYADAELALRQALHNMGYARASVARSARVDVRRRTASVRYSIAAGPPCVFGALEVDGIRDVAPRLVTREAAFQPGDPFRPEAVAETRRRLLALDLFRSVQVLATDDDANEPVVDLTANIKEKPPRALRVGVGYGTEDQFRTQFRWSHMNLLGDGRRFVFDAKYSALVVSGLAQLVQPHFFSSNNRGILELAHEQDDEDTYVLNESRIVPRVERDISGDLTVTASYKLAYVQLNDVDDETIAAIGGLRREGVVSGVRFSLTRDTTRDKLDPKSGSVVSFAAEQAGVLLGGAFAYYKLELEAKRYLRLPFRFILAGRAKLSVLDSLDEPQDVPLHERAFVGGDRSVRGFGRRRLGPLSSKNDALGGLSATETIVELRRPIWGALGGAVFADAGWVSLDAYDFDKIDLEPSVGAGLSYLTPLGPLRLDVGIPFDPPAGDPEWRVHFSVGQYF